MAAWGKTGRVTLDDEALPAVYVDGRYIGYFDPVDYWTVVPGGVAQLTGSRDGAVLWLLKRADVTLWMEERGPVPVVFRSRVKYHPANKARWGRLEALGGSWTAPGLSFHESWEEAVAA